MGRDGKRHQSKQPHTHAAPESRPTCARLLPLTHQTETAYSPLTDNFTMHYVRHVGCIIITIGGAFALYSDKALCTAKSQKNTVQTALDEAR